MSLAQELNQLLREYDGEIRSLQKNRRFFDGLFGMGGSAANAPCHDRLDRAVEELCGRAAEETAEAPERAELVREILQAQGRWQGPEYARLMLAALQRHTLGLIPLLEAGNRATLLAWYEKEYPRRKRLPVQDQILKALKT